MSDKSRLWQDARGVWHCRYYAGGTTRSPRVRKTLGEISAKDAKRQYAALIARARARGGRHYLRASLEDCAESWAELHAPGLALEWAKTCAMYLNTRLIPAFGGRPADELDPGDVERYRLGRLREGASNATVNREVSVLMSVLSHGLKVRLLDQHPFARGSVESLAEGSGRIDFFSPEEWRRFRAAFEAAAAWEEARGELRDIRAKADGEKKVGRAPGQDLRAAAPVFDALLLTGSRLSEILHLRWDAVDLERGVIRIFQRKTKDPKTQPISPELREVLEAQPRALPGAYVFRDPQGRRWTRERAYDAFVIAKRMAKLRDELIIHSLRHTAASWLTIAGEPTKNVQSFLGHADARTTAKYQHLAPEHLQGSAGLLGRVSRGEALVDVRRFPGKIRPKVARTRRGAGVTGAAKSLKMNGGAEEDRTPDL